MGVNTIVQQIINSEEPTETFAKIAQTLDDNWKTTVAREVNKAMFHKKMNESGLNSDVEFDVINSPVLQKTASVNTDKNKKFRTDFLEKKAELKKQNITPDMFDMFNERQETIRTDSYSARGIDPTFEKVASAADIKDLDVAVTKIAVLDSGVNYNNPALKRRMWTNTKEIPGDKIDNDQNGLVDDFVWKEFCIHGTLFQCVWVILFSHYQPQ